MLEEEKVKKLTMIHGEIDSGSYRSRSRVYSDKYSSNIDCLVDRILVKRYGQQEIGSKVKRKLPWKKVLVVVLALFVALAALPYVLPPLYGDFSSDVSIVLDPDGVQLNETLFVNVSIPSSYNITNVSADMAGINSISLGLVDNSSGLHLWSGNWTVFGLPPGKHIMTITALDDINNSYSVRTRLSVLTEEEPDSNESIPPDVDDGNVSDNESIRPVGLNLSLSSDKSVYVVNESVRIEGVVSYNNSLVNGSVDLFVIGPGLNLSKILNASFGRFDYEYIPVEVGNYYVEANVSYVNHSVKKELIIVVEGAPVENVTDNITKISIVDPRVDERVYALPGTSFFVERTISGLNGSEAVFAPLFSDGLSVERFEILRDSKVTGFEVMMDSSPRMFAAGRGVSIVERQIDSIRDRLPSDLKEFNRVSYSRLFSLDGPVTIRIWFRMPSWEDIISGVVPSSGRISYLTFSDFDFDFESSTWWDGSWLYRKLITINSSQADGILANFPILVNITDSDLASKAQDDGDDIAFVLWSDNSTQLNHEIELFNGTTGELLCWVNVTSLSSSEDTKIWMYYNNSGSSNQQNPTGVWDSNYIAVWHLNETSGTVYDSTANNEDSTAVVGVTQDVVGFVDGSVEFDGSSSYIDFNTNLPSTVTVSAWAYSTASSFADMLWCIDSDNQGPDLYFTGTVICLNTWNGAGNPFGSIPSNVDEWNLYTTVVESGNTNLYINDQILGSATYRDPTGSDFHISSSAGYDWEGRIDEFRISNIARNSSWIITSYNTMVNSTIFVNLSDEEQAAPIVSNPIPSDGATGVSVPLSSFNITISDPSGDNMNITWRTNESGSWVTFNVTDGGGSGVTDGTYNVTNTSWVDTNLTKYWWSVNVSDGTSWTNETYNFTTRPQNYLPNTGGVYPANDSTGIDLQVTCYFQATDLDEDTMTVYWYNSTDGISYTYQQTNSSISSGDTVYWTYTQANVYSTTYYWKFAINDTKDNVTEWYNFTTRSGDMIKPSSNVSAISPYWYGQSSNPLTIICTDAEDNTGGDGLKNVTLYYYNSTDNSTWSGPWNFGSDEDPWIECSWSFTFPNSTGYYRLYSRAADNSSPSNIEDPPATNDTECGYDIVKPSSSVDTISPYNVTTPILTINSTASDSHSGVKNVTLWYRYSINNFSWWDLGWSNRKPINLNTSSGSTPADYQVLLNVTYEINMNSNFSDIRFINYSDNTTELDYWIEDKSDGNWASVWVEINSSVSTTNQTYIWMYYGNPSAESNSNGSATFEFFDNFSGTSLDATTWTATGSANVNDGITITTGSVYTDSTVASSPQDLTFEMKAYYSGSDASYSGLEIADAQSTSGSNGGANALAYIMTDSGGQDITLWGADGTVSSYNIVSGGSLSPNPTLGSDYIFGYSFYGTSQISYFYQDLEYNDIDCATYDGTWSEPFYLWLGYFTGSSAGGTNIDDITVSWVRIRKYTSSELTSYIGSSEAWLMWNNPANPDTDDSDGWNWDFDFPDGPGYYQFYSIANDTVGNQEDTPSGYDAICKFNRLPIITDEGPSNNSIDIELMPQMNITINDPDGDTMTITWYSNSSGSWQIFGINSSVDNGTYHQTNSNFSEYTTTYWWNVTVSDGLDVNTSSTFNFTTKSIGPPLVVTNISQGVEETNATLYGYLQQDGGESCTVRFEYGTSTSYGTNTTNQTRSTGQEFNTEIIGLTNGQLHHYRAYANNSLGSDIGDDTTFLTKPQLPTSLSSQANNSNTIYLTWTKGQGANNTYIERNTTSNWPRGDGTEIYNGTVTTFEDTGLSQGTTYYYQAWSFVNWTYDSTTLYQWSDDNDTTNSTTNFIPTITGEVPTNASTGIALWPVCNVTVIDNDTSDTLNVSFYENTTGIWVLQQTNTSVTSGSNVVWSNYSNASKYNTEYQWSVNVTDGTDWLNESYYFTTTPIITSVDTISPYEVTTSPLTINATSQSDIDNITLWYRYSLDNMSWCEWDNNWNYYQLLTIDSSYMDSSLINFPVLVVINSTVGAKCDDGDSIRFLSTDNSTEFYYEIEKWNASGDSYVWVNISETIPSNSDYTFLMYYNNSNANDNQSANNVWDQYYMAVYHLNETSGQHNDSTSNGYDSTTVQVTQQGTDIGQLDGADEFDGSNDYVAIPSGVNPTNKITVECWLQSHDNFYQGVWQLVSKYNAYILGTDSSNSNRVEFIIYDTTWRYGNHYSVSDPTVWHYFAGTYNATTTNKYLYVDGNLEQSDTNGVGNINNDGGPCHLAHREYDSTGSNHYDGEMDEVRISNTDRSSAWIKATYHAINQTSDFMVWGGENGNTGIGWTNWSDLNNPDISSPWGWEFNFPNGTGYYEFYSIGKKLGSDDEIAPDTADTRCHFNQSTSINVTPSQWNIGIIGLGNTTNTTGFDFNLTNEGNVALNIQIKASNATNVTTGFEWQLNATPDFDNFTLQYNLSDSGTWTNINLTYDTFVTDLAVDSWKTFDLKLLMATTSSKSDPLSVTVTFRSVAA